MEALVPLSLVLTPHRLQAPIRIVWCFGPANTLRSIPQIAGGSTALHPRQNAVLSIHPKERCDLLQFFRISLRATVLAVGLEHATRVHQLWKLQGVCMNLPVAKKMYATGIPKIISRPVYRMSYDQGMEIDFPCPKQSMKLQANITRTTPHGSILAMYTSAPSAPPEECRAIQTPWKSQPLAAWCRFCGAWESSSWRSADLGPNSPSTPTCFHFFWEDVCIQHDWFMLVPWA